MLRPRTLLLWALFALATGAFTGWLTSSSLDAVALPPVPPPLEALARETPSDDAEAQARLATELLREAQRSGEARLYPHVLRAARRSLALDAGRTDAARLVLAALQETQQYEELLTTARAFSEQHPSEPFFVGAIGDAALELGRYDAAEAAYQRLKNLEPSLATSTRLGRLRRVKGDARGALETLKPARTLSAGEPVAVAHALCEMGEAYLALGDADIALEAFSVALSRDAHSARAHAGRGHVLRMRGENEDAIAAYNAALRARPLPATRALLADALTAAGWTAEASAHYEHALEESRERDVRFHTQLLLDLGRELPRAETLARAEYARRQDVYTEGLLAYALVLNGKVDEAHDAASHALRMGTQDARLSYVAGLVASARGEDRAARRHLSEALQAFPPLPPALHARARTLLGGGTEASLTPRGGEPVR